MNSDKPSEKNPIHEAEYRSTLRLSADVHKRLKKESFLETMLRKIMYGHLQKNEIIWRQILKKKARTDAKREEIAFFMLVFSTAIAAAFFLPFAKATFLFKSSPFLKSETAAKVIISTIVASITFFLSDWKEERKYIQFLLSGIIFVFFNYYLTIANLEFLFGDFSKNLIDGALRRNIILMVIFVILVMWGYLFMQVIKKLATRYIKLLKKWNKTREDILYNKEINELKKDLNTVSEEFKKVSKEELKRLLIEFAPTEYSDIMRLLKVDHSFSGDFVAKSPIPVAENKNMRMPLYLGVRADSSHLTVDLKSLVNILVVGVPGSGKSDWLRHFLLQALRWDGVDLILMDPEKSQLGWARNEKNVKLLSSVPQLLSTIEELIKSMIAMRDKFNSKEVFDIDQYNSQEGVEKIKRKILVIDELADIMEEAQAQQKKEFIDLVKRLTRLGRKWGVTLVVATQRSSKEVVDPNIRACLPTRVVFYVADKQNSTIAGVEHAHKLVGGPGMASVKRAYHEEEPVQSPKCGEEAVKQFMSKRIIEVPRQKSKEAVVEYQEKLNDNEEALLLATDYLHKQLGDWISLKQLIEIAKPEKGAKKLAKLLQERGFTKENGKYRRTGRGPEYRA